MAYDAAVRMMCFVRDSEHSQDRKIELANRIGESAFFSGSQFEMAGRASDSNPLTWSLLESPHGLPLFEIHLFISRPDGSHENICLEEERALVDILLRDRIVDVAEFSKGLPLKNPGWLKKYEPGFVVGERSFVALALLKIGAFPSSTSIAAPMKKFLNEKWMFIDEEVGRISLLREQWREFELESSMLPIFSCLGDKMRVAAERL